MTRIGTLTLALVILGQGVAIAQPAPTPAPAPAPAPAPTPAAPPAATPAPAPAPAPAPEPIAPAPLEATPLETTATPIDPVAEAEGPAEPTPAPTVTGFVETAYHLNLSEPHGDIGVPLRSYDGMSGNTFLLHAAHLAVSHSFNDEVSATIELDAGSDAALTASAPLGGGLVDVQEAYAKYSSDGFTLTAGKFVTYAGTEVIEGPLNPTLTRGYLFGMAESFTHTGVKAHYTTDGGVDLGIGLVNGWDLIVDNNDWKTILFRVGYSSDSFFIGGSGSFGAEQASNNDDHRLSLDLTGGVITGDWTINFQANFGLEDVVTPAGTLEDNWFGLGIQPVYTSDAFSFGGRVEWFMNKEGTRVSPAAPVADASILNITLTPGYTLAEHFTARFEYRMDVVLDAAVTKDQLNGESMQHTIGVGAHYVFN